jgi:hypothetical protein
MKHFVIFLWILIPIIFGITFVIAAPFDTDFVTWTQPNGFTFTARLWGDEFQWWFETQSGYRIIQGSNNWYYYATLNFYGEYPQQSKD